MPRIVCWSLVFVGFLFSLSVSTDWLLLAYAQHANFQLAAAEKSITQRLSIDPNIQLSLTNLALLQFADDRLAQTRNSIESALQIDAE